ncbi:hypothetical protein [Caenimonas aquaedulcis]|uniref:Uncharacterized protein n=1 Tax=Caenimonas aquaedulcis TaxID=2793270 RepID=A0A931H6P9_9BURK|nr:hypothetical protein [Caenimonas aquaedulcis]MBG9389665.1 hypothetical protein [Caenimonas aquaedulcis]
MIRKPHRILQQQPRRNMDPQQQQGGSNDFQPKAAGQKPEQQMGEGSYEGTRDYNQRTAEYLKKNDVQKDAEAARPRSEQEAAELKRAEEEGKSHSKGEH